MQILCLLMTLLVGQPAAADRPSLRDTVGAPTPAGGIVLFGGGDLAGWVKSDGKTPADWPVADGILTVGAGRGNIRSETAFDSFTLHIEFNVPYMPDETGQGRGNSGVYLQGRYELQVLDSYGLKPRDNDCGAIYKQVAPAINACKPPLQWQSYDVTFQAAEVEGGQTVRKARVTVVQNGVPIIVDREISPTPGGIDMQEGPPGPLLLQDHGDAVQYRNIWIAPQEGVAQDCGLSTEDGSAEEGSGILEGEAPSEPLLRMRLGRSLALRREFRTRPLRQWAE